MGTEVLGIVNTVPFITVRSELWISVDLLRRGIHVVNELFAKHRAAVLRPILELEKRGEPISAAIGDAAWELGLAKSHTCSLYRRLSRPVAYLCRSKYSFKPLSVRRRPGFSNRVLSGGG